MKIWEKHAYWRTIKEWNVKFGKQQMTLESIRTALYELGLKDRAALHWVVTDFDEMFVTKDEKKAE